MANHVSIRDQNGKNKLIQVYDETRLQQYDEAELIVHITSLQTLLGPENCPSTPRLDATRDELIARVLELQRRVFHSREVALEREALNLCKVSVAVDAAQKAPLQGFAESQDSNMHECKIAIQKEREAREEACSSLAQQWRNTLAEEKLTRAMFEEKITNAILRCDKLMQDDHCNMTQMKSDLLEVIKAEVSGTMLHRSKVVSADDVLQSVSQAEMKKMQESLYQLASRSAKELNSLWASMQELQKSTEARISDLTKVVNNVKSESLGSNNVRPVLRSEVQSLHNSLQQLAHRSEQELNSLSVSVQKLQKSDEAQAATGLASMKQLQDMVAESRLYEQTIRRETKDREANDLELQERWSRSVLETQKAALRKEVETRMVECGVTLQNDFNVERKQIAEQMCEFSIGLQQMCEAFNRAITQPQDQQRAGQGSRSTLVRELGQISGRLAQRSRELMRSEEKALAKGSHFEKFTKMLCDQPCMGEPCGSKVYQRTSLDSLKYESKPQLGDCSKRLQVSDLYRSRSLSPRSNNARNTGRHKSTI